MHPITKKRINIGLGAFPEIPLALARKMALEARELVARGIAPKAKRDAELLPQKSLTEQTFQKIAHEWMSFAWHRTHYK